MVNDEWEGEYDSDDIIAPSVPFAEPTGLTFFENGREYYHHPEWVIARMEEMAADRRARQNLGLRFEGGSFIARPGVEHLNLRPSEPVPHHLLRRLSLPLAAHSPIDVPSSLPARPLINVLPGLPTSLRT